MPMTTYEEIQAGLKGLTPRQRQQIATWIYGYADEVAMGVAEPAVAYDRTAGWQLSVEDYLEMEESAEGKHEYVAGEIFAMSGVSREHNLIAINVMTAIYSHVRGGPCKVFTSDFKVRLRNNNKEFIYYPDTTVACGSEGMEKHWLTNPKLIVEVLSPSTESTDRREKAMTYRATPTLEEYILVAQDEPWITIQRRTDNWASQQVGGPDAMAEFRSIGLSLPLARIYEGVW